MSDFHLLKIDNTKRGFRAEVQTPSGKLIVPLTASESERMKALFVLNTHEIGKSTMGPYQRSMFSRLESQIVARVQEFVTRKAEHA